MPPRRRSAASTATDATDTTEPPAALHPPQADPDSGADETLIRWMLSLTPTERLQWAQDMADTVEALREGREV